ncbi:MAG TPA: glycosyltransferase family 39 protein [Nitrospirales bacterium]
MRKSARYLLALGIALAGLVLALYAISGFHALIGLAWLASIILISFALKLTDKDDGGLGSRYGKRDIVTGVLLAALFSPIYLLASYQIPFQVNSDELIHVSAERLLTEQPRADAFGLLSSLFYFPSGTFILNAFLSERLGGTTLENVRRVSGFYGICIVFAGYLFFRLFSPRKLAVLATLLLASSHVLIALSRMAMRENMCVLVELAAVTLSIRGLQQQHTGKLFAGGAVMGLGVYTYFSARIIPLVWFGFLTLAYRPYQKDRFLRFLKLAAPTIAGFAISAGPMVIATWKSPPAQHSYTKTVMTFTTEGQAIVRGWEGTTDTTLALLKNLVNGLGTFNYNLADHGYTYFNPGYGFVDPLTGILLWAGVLSMWRRQRPRDLHLLALTGFLVIWLTLSLFTTKNPQYSRLLVILPFVVLLAMEGAKWLAAFAARYLTKWFGMPRRKTVYALLSVLVAVVLASNLRIYGRYVAEGFYQQEVLGSVVRYVQARQNLPNSHYYVMDEGVSQFWLGAHTWLGWISLFMSPQQQVQVLPQSILDGKTLPAIHSPSVLLMSTKLWTSYENQILQWYPRAVLNHLDGGLMFVAVEIF